MARVLVADDEEGFRDFVRDVLLRAGHEVTAVADGRAAVNALATASFDLVLTDLRMPHGSGLDVLAAARARAPSMPVLVLTAFGDVPTAVEAMRQGATDYLQKPVESPAALRAWVSRTLDSVKKVDEAPPPPKAVSTAASVSSRTPMEPRLSYGAPAMDHVVDAVPRLGRTDATVLLQGETGTGKELLARAIHEASARCDKPFVAVNCAVLSDNLVESELFGHERGAFTGAVAQRRGRLELADRGTFFLDEVGELPLPTQAKLLRVLEERAFARVGGERAITIDVRWIAATHRDLRGMVATGHFREDLYHRLAVFPLRLPPLRDRPEDIGPLARGFLRELAPQRSIKLSPAAERHLLAARFSGNVRELRNVLERALVLADGDTLEIAHLRLDGPSSAFASGPASPVPSTTDGPGSARGVEPLEATERRQIERALAAVGGNRREAAARLGIGLRTLYDKLKRYRLGLADRGVDSALLACAPMTTDATFRCACGKLRGQALALGPDKGTRLVCHCRDCRAFVRFLEADGYLDQAGGTDIVHVAPGRVRLTGDLDTLACLRLSPKGMFRWYCSACRTPIANTLGPNVPLVALFSKAIDTEAAGRSLDELVGSSLGHIYVEAATGPLPASARRGSLVRIVGRDARLMAGWALSGAGKPSPFFGDHTGAPRGSLRVLDPVERKAIPD